MTLQAVGPNFQGNYQVNNKINKQPNATPLSYGRVPKFPKRLNILNLPTEGLPFSQKIYASMWNMLPETLQIKLFFKYVAPIMDKLNAEITSKQINDALEMAKKLQNGAKNIKK